MRIADLTPNPLKDSILHNLTNLTSAGLGGFTDRGENG